MAKLLLIGMGTGDPDLLTVQAVLAMNRVDVFIIPDKGGEKAELRERRLAICEQYIENDDYRVIEVAAPKRNKEFDDYRANVEEWHGRIEEQYAKLFAEEIDAVEAMAVAKKARRLSVLAVKDGDSVRVEVRDTGPGLADADRIFDAFYTTKESGMGMGLAVSRSIVESHGGRLWAEQSEGGGAAFIFTLPLEVHVPA